MYLCITFFRWSTTCYGQCVRLGNRHKLTDVKMVGLLLRVEGGGGQLPQHLKLSNNYARPWLEGLSTPQGWGTGVHTCPWYEESHTPKVSGQELPFAHFPLLTYIGPFPPARDSSPVFYIVCPPVGVARGHALQKEWVDSFLVSSRLDK